MVLMPVMVNRWRFGGCEDGWETRGCHVMDEREKEAEKRGRDVARGIKCGRRFCSEVVIAGITGGSS